MYSKHFMKGALRAFCSIVLLFLLSVRTQAQSNGGWNLHKTMDGVEVYIKISKCSVNAPNPLNVNSTNPLPDVVMLKFVNTDTHSKTIRWNSELNSSSTALVHNLVLASKGTTEVSCSDSPTLKLGKISINPEPQSLKEAFTFLNISIETN